MAAGQQQEGLRRLVEGAAAGVPGANLKGLEATLGRPWDRTFVPDVGLRCAQCVYSCTSISPNRWKRREETRHFLFELMLWSGPGANRAVTQEHVLPCGDPHWRVCSGSLPGLHLVVAVQRHHRL